MSLSLCCAYLSLIGIFFFASLTLISSSGNPVFHLHKAGGLQRADQTTSLLLNLSIVSIKEE